MPVKLSTFCLHCDLPYGQGDHTHCLTRLRQLKLVEGQRDVVAQVVYLGSQRYRRVPLKQCPCGEFHRWRGSRCHAHSRAWAARYGGVLERKRALRKPAAVAA